MTNRRSFVRNLGIGAAACAVGIPSLPAIEESNPFDPRHPRYRGMKCLIEFAWTEREQSVQSISIKNIKYNPAQRFIEFAIDHNPGVLPYDFRVDTESLREWIQYANHAPHGNRVLRIFSGVDRPNGVCTFYDVSFIAGENDFHFELVEQSDCWIVRSRCHIVDDEIV